MPHEGSSFCNENSRKLIVFDWRLNGSHSLFCSYFDKYLRVMVD